MTERRRSEIKGDGERTIPFLPMGNNSRRGERGMLVEDEAREGIFQWREEV